MRITRITNVIHKVPYVIEDVHRRPRNGRPAWPAYPHDIWRRSLLDHGELERLWEAGHKLIDPDDATGWMVASEVQETDQCKVTEQDDHDDRGHPTIVENRRDV